MNDQIEISSDFKFTEEIFILSENDLKSEKISGPYDIIFHLQKVQSYKNKVFINNSDICKQCYYQEFTEKLINTRKSKRQDFIIYQMNLRKEKYKFLEELEELIIDNENFLIFKKLVLDIIIGNCY